jgi:FixJ family two-component response regulator
MSPQRFNDPGPIVHIVDDDTAVCKSISLLVRAAGLQAQSYASAGEFLSRYRPDGPACLVLDVRMPDMDGLALQAALTEKGLSIPIIMISGQADIPMAVSAIQQGALDFVEKPFTRGRLLELVR